jgi:tetratricopeptide (TPR) repeat protein
VDHRLSSRFRLDPAGTPVPEADIDAAARHYQARDYAAAARVCDAILQRQPRDFDALHLRGVLCLEQQQPAEALPWLRRAQQVRLNDPQLLFHIGNVRMALGQHAEAQAAYRESLALRPGHFDSLNNLGNALASDLRHAEAVGYFRQAHAQRPGAPQPLYNLGRSLLALERPDEAMESLRAALAQAGPDTESQRLIDLYSCLGDALTRQCRYEEALAVCRAAPAAIADAPALAWNTSLTLLMLGEYAEGWRKYESRFLVPDHDAPRESAAVLNLNEVAGRRVLVFPEQGRGDMIQFARYLPLLAARGATVLVEMYADLKPLFEALPGVAQIVLPEATPPEHDLLTPLLSLPSAFGTLLDSIPAQVPYLLVPDAYQDRWAARLGPRRGPRIGVAWWGSQHIAKRSMPIGMLAPVLRRAGVEFHALQKVIAPADQSWLAAHGMVIDHSAALEDFADTAALIAQMDMVISIDTAVAHLAGALGKTVWIMLPFSPDWRWLRDRDDSPWYPTARLFRQPRAGEWDDVVRRVAEALD